MSLTPVRSILKNAHPSRELLEGKGIQWDEENLTYNEQNKSSTMKIDEADTPYRYSSDGEDEEDEEDVATQTSINTKLNAALMDISEDPVERQTVSLALVEDKEGERPRSKLTSEASSPHTSSEKESEFARKRKQHYNEFQRVKEHREKQFTE